MNTECNEAANHAWTVAWNWALGIGLTVAEAERIADEAKYAELCKQNEQDHA